MNKVKESWVVKWGSSYVLLVLTDDKRYFIQTHNSEFMEIVPEVAQNHIKSIPI